MHVANVRNKKVACFSRATWAQVVLTPAKQGRHTLSAAKTLSKGFNIGGSFLIADCRLLTDIKK